MLPSSDVSVRIALSVEHADNVFPSVIFAPDYRTLYGLNPSLSNGPPLLDFYVTSARAA